MVLRRLALVVVALLVAVGACTDDDPGDADGRGRDDPGATGATGATGASDASDASDEETTPAGALPELTPVRVASLGGRPALVDGSGRQVLLRGATFTGLADLQQADPVHPPTRPPTDDDWDDMAAAGFGVVRLAVSWSALEPVRGQIDTAAVERIREAVEAAASRRIHTVIAMHQVAWGRAVATPPGTPCPPGTVPAIGWSGAPPWATLTDGASTCRPPGPPHAVPAAQAAFRAFYENRDGIRDAFAATWHRLVAALGPTPAIAGYDLFDEPDLVLDPVASEQRYTELLRSTLAEVRAGEAEAGVEPRVAFVQPLRGHPLPGTLPTHPLAVDDQVAYAPHVAGPPEAVTAQAVDEAVLVAAQRGWPLWFGETGVAAVDDPAREANRRFAAAQDDAVAGGAHWQWRQWCGDPHAVDVPGRPVTEVQVQVNDVACPDDVDTGPNEELMAVAGRAHPRAAPGRITDLVSDPDARTLRVAGVIEDDLASGGDLVVWLPGDERPEVTGTGLGEPRLRRVPGGWYATVEVVDSPYELEAR